MGLGGRLRCLVQVDIRHERPPLRLTITGRGKIDRSISPSSPTHSTMISLGNRWESGPSFFGIGHALVFLALFARFGKKAWRALAPTVLGSLLVVAAVGLMGEKLELFHVLAL